MLCIVQGVCCPYGLIFGGTDVNECGTDHQCKDIMQQAICNARSVNKAVLHLPNFVDRFYNFDC